MALPAARPSHPTPARWRPIAVVLLLALLWHALLLGLLPVGVGAGRDESPRSALQARQIAPAPAPAAAAGPAPTPQVRAPRRPAEWPAPPVSAAPAMAATSVASAAPAASAAASETMAAAPLFEAPLPVPELALAESGPAVSAVGSSPAAGVELPVFPTRPPPAVLLEYTLRRGSLVGRAELVWRPQAESYQLTMNSQAFGLTLIAWVSQGGFDSAGLAPTRFLDRRQSRHPRAANFQREAGRISFSGPDHVFPLVPGAQDRLSWMLQLPAILNAAGPAPAAGTRYPLFVVGARGDADVWTFVVEGPQAVDLPAGRSKGALLLVREPRRPYDTRVEVWLDPAQQHLPVRLRIVQTGSGETSEFLLEGLRWLP